MKEVIADQYALTKAKFHPNMSLEEFHIEIQKAVKDGIKEGESMGNTKYRRISPEGPTVFINPK